MASIEQMRSEIRLAYPGPAWSARVDRMGESQVFAVYHRLSTTGKLEDALKQRNKAEGKQLSIFDKEFQPV